MLDSGFDIDIEAINENIAEAEVVTFFFPMLRKTLLVDVRCNDAVGPLVRVVPMARGVADRFKSLESLRPGLPKPESITAIPWTRRVESIRQDGVWDGVVARLHAAGGTAMADEAYRCLEELRTAEILEVRCAVNGVGYRTVWGRAGAGDEG